MEKKHRTHKLRVKQQHVKAAAWPPNNNKNRLGEDFLLIRHWKGSQTV